MISLIPVTTAWMAESKLAAVPVFVYALNFVLMEIAHIAFERIDFFTNPAQNPIPERHRIAQAGKDASLPCRMSAQWASCMSHSGYRKDSEIRFGTLFRTG